MEYFKQLGENIHRTWDRARRDEESFVAIAADALDTTPPHLHIDRENFFDEVLRPGASDTKQLGHHHAFGQPGVTLYHGGDFVIDVYFWLQSLPAIHNHPFRGVFTILEGFSLHAVYSMEEQRRFSDGTRLGRLELEALELLKVGEIKPFSRQLHPLIHALVHVPIPSMSMVVRTVQMDGYLRYMPPGLALPLRPLDPPTARALALLESLRQAHDPGFRQRLDLFLRQHSLSTAVNALSSMWADCTLNDKSHLTSILEETYDGHCAMLIHDALERFQQVYEADQIRRTLKNPKSRLVATSLMLGQTRAHILTQLNHVGDADALLEHFLRDTFETDDLRFYVAQAMRAGHDLEATYALLQRTLDNATVEQHKATIRAIHQQSFLSPLITSC